MKDLVGVILLSSLVALFMFYELPFVTLKTPPYMFRAELYGKRPKEFEASGFPSCILNNAHFFETSHKNQKSFMMSGKVGTFSKQNGICRRYFFLWGFCIPNSRAAAYVIEKQTGSCRRSLLSQGLYVQSVKTTTYVCSRFNTSFCNKDHKTQ